LETTSASRSGKELKTIVQGMLSGWEACPFLFMGNFKGRNMAEVKTQKPGNKKRKIYYIILILVIFLVVWRTAGRKNLREETMKTEGEKVSKELVVATTTSLQDSGLLDVLMPAFEKGSGYKVKLVAVGTGEALEMGRRQVADLLLVHAPELEEAFMDSGYGDRREEIMTSNFIIVGPASDPVRIKDKSFPEAFYEIARQKALFVSRADNSGTHFLERKIWAEAGTDPEGNWYYQTGQGMAESLLVASEKNAYILADYPTFYRLKNKLNLESLALDTRYQNIYSAISVRNRNGKINVTGARALTGFLISKYAQRLIENFTAEQVDKSGQASSAGMKDNKTILFRPLRLSPKTGSYIGEKIGK
jgi:tungstate transport system substrate-binding protein